jgi:hypothetical protein
VKIRGFRIELGEIESRLQEHADVDEAVVLALDLPGGKQLVGYLVCARQADSDAQPAARSGQGRRPQHLPDYMVPAHLVLLDSLPLMGNGARPPCAAGAGPEQARQHYQAPATSWKRNWRRSGATCSTSRASACRTTSSNWAATRSCRSRWSAAPASWAAVHPRDLFQHQTIQTLAAVAPQRRRAHRAGPRQGAAA